MLENTPFNDEWNKLQKTFWDNVGSNFSTLPAESPDAESATQSQQASFFNQWLNNVDQCWQNHAQLNSGDIDTLYIKISSSSRIFFNFTESLASNKQGETADVLIAKYLEEFANKTTKKTKSEQSTSEQSTSEKSNVENKTDANDTSSQQKDNSVNNFGIDAFWKIPLQNWEQQSAFFTSHNQSLKYLSGFLGDAVNNPEFSKVLEAYLIALQEYQRIFYMLFINAAKHTVEALKMNLKQSQNGPASAKQIMSIWLEQLETHYLMLIATEDYSRAYANVVNNWMGVIDKSNKSFAEFMQATVASTQSSTQANSNG